MSDEKMWIEMPSKWPGGPGRELRMIDEPSKAQAGAMKAINELIDELDDGIAEKYLPGADTVLVRIFIAQKERDFDEANKNFFDLTPRPFIEICYPRPEGFEVAKGELSRIVRRALHVACVEDGLTVAQLLSRATGDSKVDTASLLYTKFVREFYAAVKSHNSGECGWCPIPDGEVLTPTPAPMGSSVVPLHQFFRKMRIRR